MARWIQKRHEQFRKESILIRNEHMKKNVQINTVRNHFSPINSTMILFSIGQGWENGYFHVQLVRVYVDGYFAIHTTKS